MTAKEIKQLKARVNRLERILWMLCHHKPRCKYLRIADLKELLEKEKEEVI